MAKPKILYSTSPWKEYLVVSMTTPSNYKLGTTQCLQTEDPKVMIGDYIWTLFGWKPEDFDIKEADEKHYRDFLISLHTNPDWTAWYAYPMVDDEVMGVIAHTEWRQVRVVMIDDVGKAHVKTSDGEALVVGLTELHREKPDEG